ncbi:MAG: POTRA domain-containing protein, partial [Candidatus Binataceae bacterium]
MFKTGVVRLTTWCVFLGVIVLFVPPSLLARPATIARIEIEGNQRVETDAIRIHISQQAGQPIDENTVNDDIKAIYKMGFFDTVSADKEYLNGSLVLVYT